MYNEFWRFNRKKPAKATGRRHTQETINQALRARKIQLIEAYRGGATPVRFRCECGYEWIERPRTLLYQSRGCPHPKCTVAVQSHESGKRRANRKNKSYFDIPDAPELDSAALADHAVRELIAEICRDYGLPENIAARIVLRVLSEILQVRKIAGTPPGDK